MNPHPTPNPAGVEPGQAIWRLVNPGEWAQANDQYWDQTRFCWDDVPVNAHFKILEDCIPFRRRISHPAPAPTEGIEASLLAPTGPLAELATECRADVTDHQTVSVEDRRRRALFDRVAGVLSVLADRHGLHANILRGNLTLDRMQALHLAGATDYDGLRAENARLREALQTCLDTFARYTRVHAAKNTVEGTAKAFANRDLAEMCRSALATPAAQAGEDADPFARTWDRNPNGCGCWTCSPRAAWFVTCPKCGNKRCPKASNHAFACTGSNEPGQVGVLETAQAGEEGGTL